MMIEPKVKRPLFDKEIIKKCLAEIEDKIFERLKEKGWGIYVSRHENLGIITEEYTEYVETVHQNDIVGQRKELLDLAVGALASMVSMDIMATEDIPSGITCPKCGRYGVFLKWTGTIDECVYCPCGHVIRSDREAG